MEQCNKCGYIEGYGYATYVPQPQPEPVESAGDTRVDPLGDFGLGLSRGRDDERARIVAMLQRWASDHAESVAMNGVWGDYGQALSDAAERIEGGE